MRAEGGEDDPLTLLLCHHRQDQEDAEDCSLIRRTWQESKELWQIAGPSIFSRIAMFSVTVITQSFAGHLSDLDLTAISIVTTVIISISFGFMLGMASALETLCGQAYGAKQYHMLGIHMQRSWTDAVAEQTGLVALWSIPFHLSFPFQMTLQRFLQSQLKMGVIAWVSGGVLALHVFVSWLFVLKLEIGIVGTILTIGFAWWVSVVALFAYTVCGGCPETWTGFSVQAFLGLWDFFKLAVASGVMLLLENFYYRCLVIMSGFMNNAEISIEALSICMTIYAWESMIPLGFLAATGVRVANELGAGNAKGAKFATTVSVLTSLAVGLLFWVTVLAFNKELAMIFTSSIPVIETGQ
ncbi:protein DETOXIFICATION 27-like isoform X1 [Pyrus x bretschneideri]|uniref:protein DETOXIFICATION 27-like isoform X1 n=1 Tax=Pyrus x bretschneideri TaxID=225117 RepID=UPI00202FD33D|nr:protein DETOXIFICATION 27-like isoform X1 [Pyrus x bretschneideri]